jgi:hypothetical protein
LNVSFFTLLLITYVHGGDAVTATQTRYMHVEHCNTVGERWVHEAKIANVRNPRYVCLRFK